jgi:glutathione S-transferase
MLTLYYKPTCAFSHRVVQMAENLKVELELKDISEDQSALDDLLQTGGKVQTPFMVDSDRGVSMYESGDIVDYIRENYANTSAGAVTAPRIHVGGATCVSCEG